jgi:hypothetical protein
MRKDLIYVFIIIGLVIIFLFREGCNQKHNDKLISDIVNYKTEAQTYKTSLGLEVSTNKALVLETQEQMKSLLSSNDTLKEWVSKFKEIKGGVIVKETTIVKEVAVPFETKIPCDFKPFKANKLEKHFSFYSTIANTGLTIDSVKIPNESRIIIGERKDNFFSKKKLVIDINNSNPYVSTSNISGFVYEPKKKWYEKTWVHLLVGMGTGIAVSNSIKK